MKNFHRSCLPKRNQIFCYSHFGHPHNSKLCGRAYMMHEVLDAENEISQATDDAVNMNIGNKELIEDENNNITSNQRENSSEQIPQVSNNNSEIQPDIENSDDNNARDTITPLNESTIPFKDSEDSENMDFQNDSMKSSSDNDELEVNEKEETTDKKLNEKEFITLNPNDEFFKSRRRDSLKFC
jgi:hypothetical protein